MDYLISFLETYGYAAMFIAMVLENANIPIPSEIVLGFSGYLIAQGVFEMNMTMIVATAAGVVGSILSYWMGEHGGRPLLKKYGAYIFFNEHKFEMAEKLFNKYGGAAVFFGRLLPGVRTFPAGIARYPMSRFVIWTLLGTIPWTILLVWLGVKLGEHWQDLIAYNHEFLVIMLVVFAIIAVFFGIRYYRNKNRKNTAVNTADAATDSAVVKAEEQTADAATDRTNVTATTETKDKAVQENTVQH